MPLTGSTVEVGDPACDDPPALGTKLDADGTDDTPATLDPGDTWIYRCSNATTAPTADCTASLVINTATATGEGGGVIVSDDDSIDTTLECPDKPPEPPLPIPPEPTPPGLAPNPAPTPPAPIVPPGPTPPDAGDLGVAGIHVRGACVTHISQVRLSGTNINDIRVTVDGRLVRRQKLRILQRNALPLRRLYGPGRHRVTVRVTFHRGAGGPPVTLTRTITVCRPRPRFIG